MHQLILKPLMHVHVTCPMSIDVGHMVLSMLSDFDHVDNTMWQMSWYEYIMWLKLIDRISNSWMIKILMLININNQNIIFQNWKIKIKIPEKLSDILKGID